MKISKKEFVQAMTENMTIFAGITRTFDIEFIQNTIQEQMKNIRRDGIIVNKRTAQAHNNYLVFSGGSRLDLPYMEFYKIDCGNDIAYICRDHGLDMWNEPFDKSMVYIVEK